MFEGKNVFIAICTRKELVVDESKIRPGLLRSNIWFANKDDYKWKTSDWIIQEIGLAFGRGLDVILLVEEGVRSRSEEHTSELQSLMRISYAVFCLKKKTQINMKKH